MRCVYVAELWLAPPCEHVPWHLTPAEVPQQDTWREKKTCATKYFPGHRRYSAHLLFKGVYTVSAIVADLYQLWCVQVCFGSIIFDGVRNSNPLLLHLRRPLKMSCSSSVPSVKYPSDTSKQNTLLNIQTRSERRWYSLTLAMMIMSCQISTYKSVLAPLQLMHGNLA
jgi:hypothetical protein